MARDSEHSEQLRQEAAEKMDEAMNANLAAEEALNAGKPTDCDEVVLFQRLAVEAREAAERYVHSL